MKGRVPIFWTGGGFKKSGAGNGESTGGGFINGGVKNWEMPILSMIIRLH